MVYGTGFDLAIIRWTISHITFTPETYYINYAEASDDELTAPDSDFMTVQYPTQNSNFSAVNVNFSLIVRGLEPDGRYGFKVVAENSNGQIETADYFYFKTRHEGKSIMTEQYHITYLIYMCM